MENRNCAFQYAKMKGEYLRSTEIVCDKTSLTIEEAKELWDNYFPDCAKWIAAGNTAEMVIWVNMETPQSYGETLEYISTDAESDGVRVWETKKIFFTQQFAVTK